jgi:DNA transposition AAA+ family ATPase
MGELTLALREAMEERKLSQSAVSRALGISTAVLSQWLSGTYPGNVTKINKAVKGFLERLQERLRVPKKTIPFQMTTVATKVFEIARMVHLDSEIGVVYGDSGIGKTASITEYVARNSDVVFIEADLGYTAKVLFQELSKRLGIDPSGSIHDMFEGVVAKLKHSERLIIIDEAEHLPYRALELLRRLYDKAGVGVLLVGMEKLILNLRGKKGEYTQLYSRVGFSARLESLKAQDTEEIVSSVVPSANGTWKAFHQESHGNTRILSKLIFRSMRMAQISNLPLTTEIVREAAKMLIV